MTTEQQLQQITGKSISEFRRELVSFGNRIADMQTRKQKEILEHVPGEIKVSDPLILQSRTAMYDPVIPGSVPPGTVYA